MLNRAVYSNDRDTDQNHAAFITMAGSKQSYYTIRFLVDRDRVTDAYRAYGYFRWVDDWLDRPTATRPERIAFLERQQALMDRCYARQEPSDLTIEEQMLASLIRRDQEPNSGLQSYIRHMMAVMSFDTNRRGQLVSGDELARYSHHLAVAVTDALHYFIDHDHSSPRTSTRYLAATGAHIAHMLRDTFEDSTAGYFNIPGEYVKSYGIDPADAEAAAYKAWVKSRVELARAYFQAGRSYLAKVRSLRCRLAGHSYIARFDGVLDAIEREDYQLRPNYSDCKNWRSGLRLSWSVLSLSLWGRRFEAVHHVPQGV